MTASKEALMETDDNASQVSHRVSLMLQEDYKQYAFKLADVVKKWKVYRSHRFTKRGFEAGCVIFRFCQTVWEFIGGQRAVSSGS